MNFSKTFFLVTKEEWNMLDSSIRSYKDLNAFKSKFLDFIWSEVNLRLTRAFVFFHKSSCKRLIKEIQHYIVYLFRSNTWESFWETAVPEIINYDCMFLLCHVRVSEWIHTLYFSWMSRLFRVRRSLTFRQLLLWNVYVTW